MPRYEFTDEKSNKFWEITLVESEVIACWGRIGTEGQTKTKSFDDGDAAISDYNKQISGKVKKGYVLVDEGLAMPDPLGKSNPELEAVIRADLDDTDAYLVYGDWLQAEGECIGELVTIQHKLANNPDDEALRESESKLLKENIEYFFGPEQPDADDDDLEFKSLADNYDVPKTWDEKSAWSYGFTNSIWKNGFIHSLVFNTGYHADDEDLVSEDAGKLLANVLATPAARFVQRIAIGEVWMQEDYEGPDTTWAIDAIAKSPCASSLLEIEVTGGDHDLNAVELYADILWKNCPNLEVFVLYAGQFSVGDIKAPKLKRFAVQTGGLDTEEMKRIVKADFPALQDLELWFGDDEYGGDCGISDVQPLLDRTDLKLSRLALMNMGFGDELCAALVDSPLLLGVKSLELTMGVIGDIGGRALVDNRDKLSHLETIKIAGWFSEEMVEELKTLADTVEVELRGDADEDEEDRYVEVSE